MGFFIFVLVDRKSGMTKKDNKLIRLKAALLLRLELCDWVTQFFGTCLLWKLGHAQFRFFCGGILIISGFPNFLCKKGGIIFWLSQFQKFSMRTKGVLQEAIFSSRSRCLLIYFIENSWPFSNEFCKKNHCHSRPLTKAPTKNRNLLHKWKFVRLTLWTISCIFD